MRSTATAIEAYAIDFNRYPPAAAFTWPDGLTTPTATYGTMKNYVSPTYIRVTPLADGWNSWFLYGIDSNGQAYAILSYAKNGTTDEINNGPTTDFNADIIYANGQFLQYPEGVQR